MQLLRANEINVLPEDRVFRQSRLRAIFLVFLVVGTSITLVFSSRGKHPPIGYYIAGILVFFLLVLHRYITARFRQTNWLARISDSGVFLQFRSYLNYHLPAEDPTVVFLSFEEIRSARFVHERLEVKESDGKTMTQFLRVVELELAIDPAPLVKALTEEAGRSAPSEKHWYGSTSTLYRDYPLRMPKAPFLRVYWQCAPGPKTFLKTLNGRVAVAEPVWVKADFAHLESLSREEQENCIRELDASGQTVDAVYAVCRLYGYGLTEADKFVGGLRAQKGA